MIGTVIFNLLAGIAAIVGVFGLLIILKQTFFDILEGEFARPIETFACLLVAGLALLHLLTGTDA